MKDAPIGIDENLEEIILVADILANITPSARDDTQTATSMTIYVLPCRSAFSRLITLTQDMERLLGRSHFGCMRLAIRKNDIDRIATRPERCKRSSSSSSKHQTTAVHDRHLESIRSCMQESLTAQIEAKMTLSYEVQVHGPMACTQPVSQVSFKALPRHKQICISPATTLRVTTPRQLHGYRHGLSSSVY